MKPTLLKLAIISAAAGMSSAHAALDLYQPANNKTDNLVWVGHMSPDTDSVASAIVAAHIYGGKATAAEEINPETTFVLNYCNEKAPEVVKDYSNYQVALVDFNQRTQLAPTVKPESLVAIIDHHAIGGAPVNAPQLVSMDIRGWGSTATILAANAQTLNVELPKSVACVGLGAILSDTVVFQSSTTTDYDKELANKLAKVAGVNDINDFGQQMLIAKSDLSHLSASNILTMDYKNFEFGGKKVGIGVAETLTADQLIERKDELHKAMKEYKETQGLDYLFFSITDTQHKRANLLWVDNAEKEVLKVAFNSDFNQDMLTLDGVTSRKRQISPAIQKAIEE
ncbi:manganese-dependent inorganic pyrophosphatase [Vibrio sp. UCD-FRSSP16_10]|uniref:manganese-dependent inorganic pyrophosphatase n=1 Tax=unclassified Vibrio TaxID=2614977 RepID=UPI0008003AE0|nr:MULTISPECIES: manganese-dependent inorganic pyrophosphatase [unclassified Vibrio]OBT09379.1 manganese-dependent inorganic pyrophosphatase [Vibrio sp. UCD-FRSSP16_30]OBT22059.1 manganese-dependent inorganic pyrophosphatase [Vibrio sp. UCD-FRSSP16_10]